MTAYNQCNNQNVSTYIALCQSVKPPFKIKTLPVCNTHYVFTPQKTHSQLQIVFILCS